MLLGSPWPAAHSFLQKGEQLGQTDRPAASHLYNGAPFPHLWSTCRYLHVWHMLMFPRLRRKAAASCIDRELKGHLVFPFWAQGTSFPEGSPCHTLKWSAGEVCKLPAQQSWHPEIVKPQKLLCTQESGTCDSERSTFLTVVNITVFFTSKSQRRCWMQRKAGLQLL